MSLLSDSESAVSSCHKESVVLLDVVQPLVVVVVVPSLLPSEDVEVVAVVLEDPPESHLQYSDRCQSGQVVIVIVLLVVVVVEA